MSILANIFSRTTLPSGCLTPSSLLNFLPLPG